ncbi:MAG: hypothetical protein AABW93_01415 [Nanoarchaeota archaeon]
MIHPSWLEEASRKELETYLEFWKGLSPIERRIFVYSNILFKSSGEVGRVFGAADVKDQWIGICGYEAPINIPRSNSILDRLKNMEGRLRRKIDERGLNFGVDNDWKRKGIDKREHPKSIELEKSRCAISIQNAFRGLVFDILFHDKGEHKIGFPSKERLEEHKNEERYRTQQAALLYLNIPKLDLAVRKWLDENRSISSYEISSYETT